MLCIHLLHKDAIRVDPIGRVLEWEEADIGRKGHTPDEAPTATNRNHPGHTCSEGVLEGELLEQLYGILGAVLHICISQSWEPWFSLISSSASIAELVLDSCRLLNSIVRLIDRASDTPGVIIHVLCIMSNCPYMYSMCSAKCFTEKIIPKLCVNHPFIPNKNDFPLKLTKKRNLGDPYIMLSSTLLKEQGLPMTMFYLMLSSTSVCSFHCAKKNA